MAETELTVSLPRLHRGQRARRQRVREAQARYVVTMCGRRWGKSTDGTEWIADGAVEGLRCGWFAPTYKYVTEVWYDLTRRLEPVTARSDGTERRIETINGGLVEAWTMDTPDPGRSRAYDRVVIDEAGLVRDLLALWTESIRPTLVDRRGSAWIYGTPKNRQHGFVQLFAKGEHEEAGWMAYRAPTRDNPYIPAEEIEAARRDMPPAAFAQEFEGMPADDGANPFGLAAIRQCLDVVSEEPAVCWGWDFARAQDWTVGVALDAYGRVCRVERWQHLPWGETRRRVAELTKRAQAVGDSTGLGDVVVESLQALNVSIAGFLFTPKSKQGLMERLANAIQSRQVRFPVGVLSQELETFSYTYTAHGVRYEAPPGLYDDAVMALALAVYCYDRVQPRVEAMALPAPEGNRDPNRWQDFAGVGATGEPQYDAGAMSQLPVGF